MDAASTSSGERQRRQQPRHRRPGQAGEQRRGDERQRKRTDQDGRPSGATAAGQPDRARRARPRRPGPYPARRRRPTPAIGASGATSRKNASARCSGPDGADGGEGERGSQAEQPRRPQRGSPRHQQGVGLRHPQTDQQPLDRAGQWRLGPLLDPGPDHGQRRCGRHGSRSARDSRRRSGGVVRGRRRAAGRRRRVRSGTAGRRRRATWLSCEASCQVLPQMRLGPVQTRLHRVGRDAQEPGPPGGWTVRRAPWPARPPASPGTAAASRCRGRRTRRRAAPVPRRSARRSRRRSISSSGSTSMSRRPRSRETRRCIAIPHSQAATSPSPRQRSAPCHSATKVSCSTSATSVRAVATTGQARREPGRVPVVEGAQRG